MQEVQGAQTVMLCVLTFKTAVETKAALRLGEQWLGTFLSDTSPMSYFFMVPEILTRK